MISGRGGETVTGLGNMVLFAPAGTMPSAATINSLANNKGVILAGGMTNAGGIFSGGGITAGPAADTVVILPPAAVINLGNGPARLGGIFAHSEVIGRGSAIKVGPVGARILFRDGSETTDETKTPSGYTALEQEVRMLREEVELLKRKLEGAEATKGTIPTGEELAVIKEAVVQSIRTRHPRAPFIASGYRIPRKLKDQLVRMSRRMEFTMAEIVDGILYDTKSRLATMTTVEIAETEMGQVRSRFYGRERSVPQGRRVDFQFRHSPEIHDWLGIIAERTGYSRNAVFTGLISKGLKILDG